MKLWIVTSLPGMNQSEDIWTTLSQRLLGGWFSIWHFRRTTATSGGETRNRSMGFNVPTPRCLEVGTYYSNWKCVMYTQWCNSEIPHVLFGQKLHDICWGSASSIDWCNRFGRRCMSNRTLGVGWWRGWTPRVHCPTDLRPGFLERWDEQEDFW